MKKFTVTAALALAGLLASGAAMADYPVSVSNFNLFKFDQPITHAYLPPKAPIDGDAVYLSNNKVLMLKFKEDKGKPVQVVVELADGTTRSIMMVPTKGIGGKTYSFGLVDAGHSAGSLGENPNARYVPVVSALLSGKMPAGFASEQVNLPSMIYDRAKAEPEMSVVSSDASVRIVRYKVSARENLTSDLDPAQFYAPGVLAALLDGTTVKPGHPIHLYLVLKIDGEGAQ